MLEPRAPQGEPVDQISDSHTMISSLAAKIGFVEHAAGADPASTVRRSAGAQVIADLAAVKQLRHCAALVEDRDHQ